ncbi:MAG: ribosome silencing factor [Lentisphaerae bacterium]|nr:ribosome silencing factor [Lentisphaerota bacterium]
MTNTKNYSSRNLAEQTVELLIEKHAENIALFDVGKTSQLTDFHIVVTGKNPPHLKALANELRVVLKQAGSAYYKRAGEPDSGWIVIDYIDVVVHLMSEEAREKYALDELWKHSKVDTAKD